MVKSKKQSNGQTSLSFPLPAPMPTLWYVEPIGPDTNEVLAGLLPEENFIKDLRCADGKLRNLCLVAYGTVLSLEEGRKTKPWRFSIWYKSKTSSEVELWRSDYSYTHRNRALRNLRRWRKGLPYIKNLITADRLLTGRPTPRLG